MPTRGIRNSTSESCAPDLNKKSGPVVSVKFNHADRGGYCRRGGVRSQEGSEVDFFHPFSLHGMACQEFRIPNYAHYLYINQLMNWWEQIESLILEIEDCAPGAQTTLS